MTEHEIEVLREMMVTQFFRDPQALSWFKQKLGVIIISAFSQLQQNVAQAWVQRLLLPSKDIVNNINNQAIGQTLMSNIVYTQIEGMNMAVGFTENDFLITSDKPVIAKSNREGEFGIPIIDLIIYPLTSNLVLCLHRNNTGDNKTNIMFKLTGQEVYDINKMVAEKAKRFILSKTILPEDVINEFMTINKEYKTNDDCEDEIGDDFSFEITTLNKLKQEKRIACNTVPSVEKLIVINTKTFETWCRSGNNYIQLPDEITIVILDDSIKAEYLYWMLIILLLYIKTSNQSIERLFDESLLISDSYTQQNTINLFDSADNPGTLLLETYNNMKTKHKKNLS